MQFRQVLSVDIFVELGSSVVFAFGGAHRVNVNIASYTSEEIKAAPLLGTAARCTAMSEQEPSDSIRAMFESVAGRQLPPGSKIPEPRPHYISEGGHVAEPFAISIGLLPDAMQGLVTQVSRELGDFATRTIRLLRWRGGQEGPHNPILSSEGFHWSFDGKDWHALSSLEITFVGARGTLDICKIHDEVATLVSTGLSEPLAHELLREALGQVLSNPRSALLVGVAAAEVGFKSLVSALVPASEWIVENVPSPPIIAMLRDFLPTLPVKCQIDGKPPRIPKDMLDTLQKGVAARNKTTHSKAQPMRQESLEELLDTIRDLLWILDYCGGFPWALDYVRKPFRTALASE
jgi:hypothetical protein